MNSSSEPLSPFATVPDGVVVAVRLTPRARGAGIDGIVAAAAGVTPPALLKIRVAAPPEDGKANDALIALLARAWRLKRADLTLIAGRGDRTKRIHIAGDPARLLPQLEASIERAS